MHRRSIILASLGASLAPKKLFATILRATNATLPLLSEQQDTMLWGFNESAPGPILRAKKGERLSVNFQNHLEQNSAIHWHGVRIINSMDGVPNMTQNAVPPNGEFVYDFIAPDAGTYWYHSHNRSWEQVARGLYGALIIEEENPPEVDHDIVVYVDDWRINEDGSLIEDFGNTHDQAHAGRLGNFAKVIFHNLETPILKNERIRLRLINVATDRIFPLNISGLSGAIVAYDGMPLASVESFDSIILAPAQRVDIIADILDEEIGIDFETSRGPYRLGSLSTEGALDKIRDNEITPLETNRYEKPDLKNAIELELNMEGGAMSARMMQGNMTRENIWSFNGVSGLPDEPLHLFNLGESAVFNLNNNTRFPHTIHLHGHHFQEIDEKGELKPLRDTLLVDSGASTKIACVFDNPGKWLLHCHMLAHQATGMKTWVEVLESGFST